jgi:hypothetical protein
MINSIFHSPKENEVEKSSFYADPETLSQGPGSNDFLNSIPIKDKWVENCADCKVPMKFVTLPIRSLPVGIVDSVRGVCPELKNIYKAYLEWVKDPIISVASEFWYCFQCKSVWTITSAFWTKVMVWGEKTVEPEKVKEVQVNPATLVEVVIDPGVKLSEDSTLCPNCHVWREVKPYDGTIRQGETYVQHVCPKCHAVDIVPIQNKSIQGETECLTTTEPQ